MAQARRRYSPALLLLVFLATTSATAKKNNPVIELQFVPQQTIGAAEITLEGEILERPAVLVVSDGRPPAQASVLGVRTNDDDKRFELLASGSVLDFVRGVIQDVTTGWAVRIEDSADLRLEVDLVRFHVSELNQAVGANYNAEVRLVSRLRDQAGNTLWKGSASGTAYRYGKKFSSLNCNEVLSDALLDCVADMLGNPGLQRAWDDPSAAAPAGASGLQPAAESGDVGAQDSGAITPAELFDEVLALLESELDPTLIVDYVKGKTLTESLSAEALIHWKNAGIPDDVIRAAVNCSVQEDQP